MAAATASTIYVAYIRDSFSTACPVLAAVAVAVVLVLRRLG